MQAFIKLRGAIFAESGYNLEVFKIAPDGIKKTSSAYLSTLDRNNKTTNIEPMPGCGMVDAECVNVPLTKYPDREKAVGALYLMCEHLARALDGWHEDKKALGEAWAYLCFQGLALAHQPPHAQIDILSNLYGKGRVHDSLNRLNGLEALGEPDYVTFVNEALNLQ